LGAKRIGDPGHQWRFGPDDDKIDPIASCEFDDSRGVARVDGHAFRPSRDSGIARRGKQPIAARRLPKAPGERILATARTQEQNIHGSS
jgi:hypothetical protein